MMCYRDMTFCPYYKICSKENCGRALTSKVNEAAKRLGLSICQFAEKPDCFDRRKNESQRISG